MFLSWISLFRYGIDPLINAVLTGHQLFGDEEAAERGDIRVERFQERIHLELMVGAAGFEALHDEFQDDTLLLELCGDGNELAIVDKSSEHLFRISGIVDELFLPGSCVAIHEGNVSFLQGRKVRITDVDWWVDTAVRQFAHIYIYKVSFILMARFFE